MILDEEKRRMKDLETALDALAIEVTENNITVDFTAEFIGTVMAMFDAFFAIREGEPWRDITEPKEIARVILRQSQMGE